MDSPTATNTIIYAPGMDFLYALNASTGSQLWVYRTIGPVTPPALANGILIAGAYDGLYAFNSTQASPTSSPTPTVPELPAALVVVCLILATSGVVLFEKKYKAQRRQCKVL